MSNIDFSICWQFPDTTPLQGLTRLRDLGYEGIELWPDALKAFPLDEWLTAFKGTGMKLFQLCPYFNFMEGQPKIDGSRAMLDEYLGYARATGCKRIRVFTGPPWGEGVVGAKDATQPQWDAAISSLTEYCDAAAPNGVELCLECHEGSLMEDAPNALKLIRGVNRPNLTTNLQIPFKGEDWQYSLDELGAYTTHIHIHNWTGVPEESPLTFLAEGTFDWRPVVTKIVKQFGKHLTLSPEHITHNNVDDPWETAKRDIGYLRMLRETVDGN